MSKSLTNSDGVGSLSLRHPKGHSTTGDLVSKFNFGILLIYIEEDSPFLSDSWKWRPFFLLKGLFIVEEKE